MSTLSDEVTVRKNSGVDVGTRRRLNFTEDGNVTLTITDDAVNQEIDIGIAASAGGGGGVASNVFSYVIYVTGGVYYALNSYTGVVDYSGATFHTVINSAITSMPTVLNYGTVYIRGGLYTVTGAVVVGEQTRIIGEGQEAVTLDVAAAVNCFEINNCSGDVAAWEISNLTIDMNGYNGYAIYAPYAHNSDMAYCSLHSLYIHSVATGYYGIYLKQPMSLYMYSIRIRTSGGGIKLEVLSSPTMNWGNSYLSEIRVGLLGANGIAYDFQGYDATHLLNFLVCHRLQTTATSGVAGTVGIKGTWLWWSDFYAIDIEDAKTGVYLTNCLGLAFNGGYIAKGAADMDYGVRLAQYVRTTTFNSMKIEAGAGIDVISSQTSRYGDVMFSNIHSGSSPPDLAITPVETIKNWYQLSTTLGNVADPFTDTTFTIEGSARRTITPLGGETSTPTASVDYVVANMPVYITSSGGTDVVITIKSQDGNTIVTNLTTLSGFYMAPMMRINFGAFSVAPTVVVSAVGNW